ncbi:integration host factor subunit alpha [Fluviispira multicolorata]|uniref:Integration host factor subunit alpha n=1 Tax=Fluviispira multicolorata TaxID=2654512 RepID=A0A833JCW4_9BACT|nr:integration host factor subunit alpha [Fluviispira multicolorata]KAB8030010.1 integration host factor subunit alpha [Fluviispira multicolorata]
MTLTKDKIVELIRSRTQFSSQEAKNLVETILESIKSKLENGEEVKISGFGKWVVREKRSRPGRNPHTGQRIEISARRVVTFHPSEKLREAVNNADLDDSKLVMAGADDDYNE